MLAEAFPIYTFDFFHQEFMFQCLAKFPKIHGLWTQFFLKKMNSLTTNTNRNVYISKLTNYQLASTIESNSTKWNQLFTVRQLFLVRSENQLKEVKYQESNKKK